MAKGGGLPRRVFPWVGFSVGVAAVILAAVIVPKEHTWAVVVAAALILLGVLMRVRANARADAEAIEGHHETVRRVLVGAIEYGQDFRLAAQGWIWVVNGTAQPIPFAGDLEPIKSIPVDFTGREGIFVVLNYIEKVADALRGPRFDEYSKGKAYWERDAGNCEIRIRTLCREAATCLGMEWRDPPVRKPPNGTS